MRMISCVVSLLSMVKEPDVAFMKVGAHFDSHCMPEDHENGAAEE